MQYVNYFLWFNQMEVIEFIVSILAFPQFDAYWRKMLKTRRLIGQVRALGLFQTRLFFSLFSFDTNCITPEYYTFFNIFFRYFTFSGITSIIMPQFVILTIYRSPAKQRERYWTELKLFFWKMDILKFYDFRQCVERRDRRPGKWRYRDHLGNMPDGNGASLGPYKYLHERIEIPQSISPEIDHDERKYSITMYMNSVF